MEMEKHPKFKLRFPWFTMSWPGQTIKQLTRWETILRRGVWLQEYLMGWESGVEPPAAHWSHWVQTACWHHSYLLPFRHLGKTFGILNIRNQIFRVVFFVISNSSDQVRMQTVMKCDVHQSLTLWENGFLVEISVSRYVDLPLCQCMRYMYVSHALQAIIKIFCLHFLQ